MIQPFLFSKFMTNNSSINANNTVLAPKAGATVEVKVNTIYFHTYIDTALATYPPYNVCKTYALVKRVSDYFPGTIYNAIHSFSTNTVVLYVHKTSLYDLVHFFRYSSLLRFTMLMDITVTDLPHRKNRFEVTYVLLSEKLNQRVYFRVFVSEWDVLPSLTSIYSSAGWLEREAWDMYGVPFTGHPDLRRILTDYGFFGHPLRKDFPLTGFYEVRYDDTTRRVVSESLNMIQELRLFSFSMPWSNL